VDISFLTDDDPEPKELQLTNFARPVATSHQVVDEMAPASYGPKDMELNVHIADIRGAGGGKVATMALWAYSEACREWNHLIKRFNERGQLISRHEGQMSHIKRQLKELENESFVHQAETEDWAQKDAQWKLKEKEFAQLKTKLALAEKKANDEKDRADTMVDIVKAREEAHTERCRKLQATIATLKSQLNHTTTDNLAPTSKMAKSSPSSFQESAPKAAEPAQVATKGRPPSTSCYGPLTCAAGDTSVKADMIHRVEQDVQDVDVDVVDGSYSAQFFQDVADLRW
jgi:hypothetical protein